MVAKNPLQTKAVLTSVTVRMWTGRKLDREVTAEVNERNNATEDAGRYNKLLIPKEAFAELYEIANTARVQHIVMTMPWWDKGTRLLPSAQYDVYAGKFRKYRTEFGEAADRFAKAYPQWRAQAPTRLKKMFREADYPHASDVRRMFDFRTHVTPVPDTPDFRVAVTKEQLDDMRTDLERDLQEALDNAMKEPIRRVLVVITKMAEKLKGYKPKTTKSKAQSTFRNSLVDNIRELLPLVQSFNLTGDKALADLYTRIERELCRTDAEALREDEDLRAATAKAAEALVKDAQALMA